MKTISELERETMDIYSKEGTPVIYTGDHGREEDRDLGNKYLKIGDKYTVDHTVVESWYTDVYLKEFPKIAFNSVLFKDVSEEIRGVGFNRRPKLNLTKGQSLAIRELIIATYKLKKEEVTPIDDLENVYNSLMDIIQQIVDTN